MFFDSPRQVQDFDDEFNDRDSYTNSKQIVEPPDSGKLSQTHID